MSTARPIGLWVMAIVHTAYSARCIWNALPSFRDPLPHGWSQVAVEWAPYLVTLYALMVVFAWATWAGYRHARIPLLVSLAIAIALYIPDLAYGVPLLLERASNDPGRWLSLRFWWGLTFGLWFLAWLALETWYLFSARTRSFFHAGRVSVPDAK